MAVLIETSQGDIVIDLYTEERPKCSLNFLKLCKVKFYNYSLFHTVQRNFLAQTGDPTGTGDGGQSIWGVIKGEEYQFFEAEASPRLKHEKVGTVSMVNNGNGYHGSQFFITLGENLDYLDGRHTVCGEVAEGLDVLMKINEAYTDKAGRPFQDIRIYHTVILEDPFSDPEGLVVPDRSPSPPKVVTDSDRIGAEEDIDEFQGKSEEEVREIMSLREAKANAEILEMVGDIPDADAKPPENVLFVCKLNPFTTSEDLEIIFSRFGPILSCEVITDQKTGDSLQYAFIEFEKEEDCVNALFKMDNVLIDDRRIHVDFSQSLAKVKGIRTRKTSEDQSKGGQLGDKFVSKHQSKGDSYEMVFDETEMRPEKKKKKKRHDSGSESDSERRHSTLKKERERGERHRERDRKEDRRRERDKEGRGRTGRHSDSDEERYRERRHREKERDHRREERRRRDDHRGRSRSRSRERHRRRSRGDSRERRHN